MADWSPTDLREQRIVVRRIAIRAEQNRRRLGVARAAFAARVRTLATSPWTIGAIVALGVLVARPATRRRIAAPGKTTAHRVRSIGASLMWLLHLYRQFERGVAAGAAFARPSTPAPPVQQGPRYEER
jgi:hypothetical protein